jgi:HD domain-containing protein
MELDIHLVDWAAESSSELLSPLGDRWLHVQGVVERACWIAEVLDVEDRPYLVAAAYLHDVGYAPLLKKTGFHPLDGAYYVQSFGYNRLASLVAHHSESRFEARLRGLESELEKFPREYSVVSDALVYCDMTTSSTGKPISFEERTEDIFCRYSEDDVVAQALHLSRPFLSLAVSRMCQKLRENGLVAS